MLDRWFSVIKLPLSWRQFHRLPQNPAYKYEYIHKAAWLSPRPKFYSARLELRPREGNLPGAVDAPESVSFRRLEDRDRSTAAIGRRVLIPPILSGAAARKQRQFKRR